MSAFAPQPPSTGTAISVTVPSTTSPPATGARRFAGSSRTTANPRTRVRGTRTKSCRTTPTSQPDGGVDQVGQVLLEQQPGAVRRGRDAEGAQQHAHPHASHLEPADPLGLQHARPVGRDQPGRVAVVDRQRLAAEAEREQGQVVVGELRRQVGHAERPVLLERGHRDRRPARRPDEVEQVAQPHAAPVAVGAPALDAGDGQAGRRLRHREEVGPAQRRRLVAVRNVEAVRRVGRTGRDPGRPGALVDRQVLRAVPRADAEDARPCAATGRCRSDRRAARPRPRRCLRYAPARGATGRRPARLVAGRRARPGPPGRRAA